MKLQASRTAYKSTDICGPRSICGDGKRIPDQDADAFSI